jgi:hypothetical protein
MMSINEHIQHSFDHFSSPIDFVEGNNKNIFIIGNIGSDFNNCNDKGDGLVQLILTTIVFYFNFKITNLLARPKGI